MKIQMDLNVHLFENINLYQFLFISLPTRIYTIYIHVLCLCVPIRSHHKICVPI